MRSLWELEAGKNGIKAVWRHPGWALHCLKLLCPFPLVPALGKVKLGTVHWKSRSGHPLWPQVFQLGKGECNTWSLRPWLNLLNREQFSLTQKKWRATHFTWSSTQHIQFLIKIIMKISMRNLLWLFHSSNYLSVHLYHLLIVTMCLLWKFLIATFLFIQLINIKCPLCSRGYARFCGNSSR